MFMSIDIVFASIRGALLITKLCFFIARAGFIVAAKPNWFLILKEDPTYLPSIDSSGLIVLANGVSLDDFIRLDVGNCFSCPLPIILMAICSVPNYSFTRKITYATDVYFAAGVKEISILIVCLGGTLPCNGVICISAHSLIYSKVKGNSLGVGLAIG